MLIPSDLTTVSCLTKTAMPRAGCRTQWPGGLSRIVVWAIPVLVLCGVSAAAQSVFQAAPARVSVIRPELAELPDYQLLELDVLALGRAVQAQDAVSTLQLTLGEMTLDMRIERSNLVRPDAVVTVLTDQGTERRVPRAPGSYRIRFPQGEGRLVMREGFLAGGFSWEGKDYIIEPYWYYQPGADPGLIVLYERDIARMVAPYRCGAGHNLDHGMIGDTPPEDEFEGGRSAGCKEVEYAYASDWLFFQKYGSESAVMDRIETIMSLVEWQFTNWFNDNYLYPISGFLISACSTCDPSEWSNTNDPYELLTNFRNWGEAGGFGNTVYDVAGLWTDRTFNNSIIGIAYLSAICTDDRYHAIMDFTPSTSLMRVLVAHELGHNFSSDHDAPGSNFIMTPNVNSTTTWSSQSMNAVNVFAANLGCLASCAQNAPPVASFEASPEEGCPPQVIQFTDLSINNPTSWQWTFMGGSPSSSTLQHPLVTYATPGTYPVTLMVSNAGGSHSVTVDEAVRIITAPQADFTFQITQRTVSFYPDAQGATDYLWEFGDGNSSTLQYPQHTYADDGQYTVTLTASNLCGDGTVTKTLLIITVPLAGFSASPLSGCLPLEVAFSDASTPNTTHWNWSFPGGTPTISSDQNPVITYGEPGTFTVSLTASNAAGGHTLTQVNYIRVDAPPTAGFVYTQSMDTVFFLAGGGPDSLLWLFGDGQTSDLPNPVHRYAQQGVFEVELTVWDDCGEDTYTEFVTILLPPVADFRAEPLTGCHPLEVQFHQEASPNTTQWHWSFPGGQPSQSNDPDPLVVYAQPGSYAVTLIAVNAAGSDTMLMPDLVVVQDDPQALWSGELLNGNELHVTNDSPHALEFFWDFGDGGTSDQAEPVHVYTAGGDYLVTLVAANACGQDTASAVVQVALPPQADFLATPRSGCNPLAVQFQDQTSGEAVAWEWIFEGGEPSTSGEQHPQVQYPQPGTYAVSLTATNVQGWATTRTKQAYVEVIGVPIAAFTAVNQQGEVVFTQQSQYGLNFQWQFGDGQTSVEEHPRHTYAAEGFYVVTLTVSNACGAHTVSEVVEVVFPPRAQVQADVRAHCGDTLVVRFEDLSQGQVDQWHWVFSAGDPSESFEPNPLVTYTIPGRHDVWFRAAGEGGADTLSLPGYIDLATEFPLAAFSHLQDGPTVHFEDGSQHATSWRWDFGDGQTSEAQDPSHAFAAPGIYTVRLAVFNPCGSDSVAMEVEVLASGTEVVRSAGKVSVYPNPSTGLVRLALADLGDQSCRVELSDALSRLLFVRGLHVAPEGGTFPLDLRGYPAGIYYLRVGWGKESRVVPVLLAR